jgi:hypothetical protein
MVLELCMFEYEIKAQVYIIHEGPIMFQPFFVVIHFDQLYFFSEGQIDVIFAHEQFEVLYRDFIFFCIHFYEFVVLYSPVLHNDASAPKQ